MSGDTGRSHVGSRRVKRHGRGWPRPEGPQQRANSDPDAVGVKVFGGESDHSHGVIDLLGPSLEAPAHAAHLSSPRIEESPCTGSRTLTRPAVHHDGTIRGDLRDPIAKLA